MERQKIDVFYRSTAKNSITRIGAFIGEKGYPERAEKFATRLYLFGESLCILPEKYSICRFPVLARNNMRCAVFAKNYVFIYKIVHRQLIIYNVVHVKALK